MKLIEIIGHPVLMMSLYFLLIIEGSNFGGVYLLYLMLALPHGVPYAIVALLGLVFVFISYKTYRGRKRMMNPIFNLVGLLLMISSLIIFFNTGQKGETFRLFIPLLTFILFGVSALSFIYNSVYMLMKIRPAVPRGLNQAL